ncbi:M1 family metallopeptidase [Winogradskyella sp. UBA3174]|uniref:M1 family metallopeptidase n=1 Tax=Winogradskyella sp. UBA3174 TaxID=1947785 RepID=UPI0025DE99A4|nr:M1 family metallopeptidase [Winogradskyella sp. UBA3174]|tara:strand:- start:6707 stop:8344 length:1638 start_codon:yes stop_codon:yes gene_type:complete
MRNISVLCFVLFTVFICNGQGLLSEKNNFNNQDTLRGSITPERSWWDLTYYHLDIEVKPETKFISGKNTIHYKVLEKNQVMQIDLQEPMVITKVLQAGKELNVTHNGNAHFVTLTENQIIGDINSIEVYYNGNPREAKSAPWDGGFSWKKDNNDKHFIATSCQGLGASVWWPNKDHMYDEVDSMLISITNPKGLMNVSNGRLRQLVENSNKTVTSHWFINNPINNYGVNVNIGDYVNFSEVFDGEKGPLDMDYWVLTDNLEKAKEHFKDAPKMMKAFEHWFGPYPFYEDSFKLVEVPYLGMEHQSSVTYGNKYMKGYLGKDLSRTGWGLKFDFIIIHEAGHEWFANNITNKDIADMWIHEGFTAYSENLFLDYYYGKEAAADYVIGTRANIQNDKPLIGVYNVNNEGSSDIYYKGANMLHTIRQLLEDDEKWRQILRGLNSEFYHKTVTTKQIEDYISKESNIDLTAFFNQYLRDVRIPTFEFKIEDGELQYHYISIVEGFDMPIQIEIGDKTQWIYPKAKWQTMPFTGTELKVDRDFYVEIHKI